METSDVKGLPKLKEVCEMADQFTTEYALDEKYEKYGVNYYAQEMRDRSYGTTERLYSSNHPASHLASTDPTEYEAQAWEQMYGEPFLHSFKPSGHDGDDGTTKIPAQQEKDAVTTNSELGNSPNVKSDDEIDLEWESLVVSFIDESWDANDELDFERLVQESNNNDESSTVKAERLTKEASWDLQLGDNSDLCKSEPSFSQSEPSLSPKSTTSVLTQVDDLKESSESSPTQVKGQGVFTCSCKPHGVPFSGSKPHPIELLQQSDKDPEMQSSAPFPFNGNELDPVELLQQSAKDHEKQSSSPVPFSGNKPDPKELLLQSAKDPKEQSSAQESNRSREQKFEDDFLEFEIESMTGCIDFAWLRSDWLLYWSSDRLISDICNCSKRELQEALGELKIVTEMLTKLNEKELKFLCTLKEVASLLYITQELEDTIEKKTCAPGKPTKLNTTEFLPTTANDIVINRKVSDLQAESRSCGHVDDIDVAKDDCDEYDLQRLTSYLADASDEPNDVGDSDSKNDIDERILDDGVCNVDNGVHNVENGVRNVDRDNRNADSGVCIDYANIPTPQVIAEQRAMFDEGQQNAIRILEVLTVHSMLIQLSQENDESDKTTQLKREIARLKAKSLQSGEIPPSERETMQPIKEIPSSKGEIPPSKGEIQQSKGEIPPSKGEIQQSKGEIPNSEREIPLGKPAELYCEPGSVLDPSTQALLEALAPLSTEMHKWQNVNKTLTIMCKQVMRFAEERGMKRLSKLRDVHEIVSQFTVIPISDQFRDVRTQIDQHPVFHASDFEEAEKLLTKLHFRSSPDLDFSKLDPVQSVQQQEEVDLPIHYSFKPHIHHYSIDLDRNEITRWTKEPKVKTNTTHASNSNVKTGYELHEGPQISSPSNFANGDNSRGNAAGKIQKNSKNVSANKTADCKDGGLNAGDSDEFRKTSGSASSVAVASPIAATETADGSFNTSDGFESTKLGYLTEEEMARKLLIREGQRASAMADRLLQKSMDMLIEEILHDMPATTYDSLDALCDFGDVREMLSGLNEKMQGLLVTLDEIQAELFRLRGTETDIDTGDCNSSSRCSTTTNILFRPEDKLRSEKGV